MNNLEIFTSLISATAVIVSVFAFMRAPKRHSDVQTSTMIRELYGDFLEMTSIRQEYPLQSHLFETPDTYEIVAEQVRQATSTRPTTKEVLQDSLRERGVAMYIFAMFEHWFYQWNHAQSANDLSRSKFTKEVVDYFTGRLLRNPRLLWYWSPSGGNLVVHFEPITVEYYVDQVTIDEDVSIDESGPFAIETTLD